MPYTEKTNLGKFEGNYSQWTAEVLHTVALDYGCDESFGDEGTYGWYGLIKGKRYWFIVDEDSQGFFSYQEFDDGEDAQKVWEMLLDDYELFLNGQEGVHTTKLWLEEG